MSDLAIHLNTPNKETSSSEGQKKKIYYTAQLRHRKRKSMHVSPSLGVQT
jgi:hypothetical protein